MTQLHVLAAVAAFMIGSAECVVAQDTTRVPGQTMLKRIAEAVDGNRTGATLYVVASYDSLNKVVGVFSNRADASALSRRLGPNTGVFGPYKSDIVDPQRLQPCVHDGIFSFADPICPPEWRPVNPADIESMSLVVRMRDGTTQTLALGRTIDAVFLSRAAVDKFMVPYYARVIGLDATVVLRRQISAAFDRR